MFALKHAHRGLDSIKLIPSREYHQVEFASMSLLNRRVCVVEVLNSFGPFKFFQCTSSDFSQVCLLLATFSSAEVPQSRHAPNEICETQKHFVPGPQPVHRRRTHLLQGTRFSKPDF